MHWCFVLVLEVTSAIDANLFGVFGSHGPYFTFTGCFDCVFFRKCYFVVSITSVFSSIVSGVYCYLIVLFQCWCVIACRDQGALFPSGVPKVCCPF